VSESQLSHFVSLLAVWLTKVVAQIDTHSFTSGDCQIRSYVELRKDAVEPL